MAFGKFSISVVIIEDGGLVNFFKHLQTVRNQIYWTHACIFQAYADRHITTYNQTIIMLLNKVGNNV